MIIQKKGEKIRDYTVQQSGLLPICNPLSLDKNMENSERIMCKLT